MGLQDATNKLDREKMDEIHMYLLMSSTLETRALFKFITEREAVVILKRLKNLINV